MEDCFNVGFEMLVCVYKSGYEWMKISFRIGTLVLLFNRFFLNRYRYIRIFFEEELRWSFTILIKKRFGLSRILT